MQANAFNQRFFFAAHQRRLASDNFRLPHRPLSQIARVLLLNRLEVVTVELVEAACESLVIGTA